VTESASPTPPGWYVWSATTEGYWDGFAWTGQTRERAVPAKPPASRALFAIARVLGLVAAALLLVALGPWPYEYYTALRIIVTGASVVLAVAAFRTKQTGWAIAAIVVAVLFNPLVPIWLDRGVWAILDVASALLLTVAALRLRR
jgi:nicotinamide riboside transporter PnuC